jgi:hypothetical protein
LNHIFQRNAQDPNPLNYDPEKYISTSTKRHTVGCNQRTAENFGNSIDIRFENIHTIVHKRGEYVCNRTVDTILYTKVVPG